MKTDAIAADLSDDGVALSAGGTGAAAGEFIERPSRREDTHDRANEAGYRGLASLLAAGGIVS